MFRLEDKTIKDIAEWLEQQGFDESVIESFRGECYASTLLYVQVFMLLVKYLSYCVVHVTLHLLSFNNANSMRAEQDLDGCAIAYGLASSRDQTGSRMFCLHLVYV